MGAGVSGGSASSRPTVQYRPFGGIDLDGPPSAVGAYILGRAVYSAFGNGDLTVEEAVAFADEVMALLVEAGTAGESWPQ